MPQGICPRFAGLITTHARKRITPLQIAELPLIGFAALRLTLADSSFC